MKIFIVKVMKYVLSALTCHASNAILSAHGGGFGNTSTSFSSRNIWLSAGSHSESNKKRLKSVKIFQNRKKKKKNKEENSRPLPVKKY